MHSGDLVELGGSDLTEVEKETLLEEPRYMAAHSTTTSSGVFSSVCVCSTSGELGTVVSRARPIFRTPRIIRLFHETSGEGGLLL